MKLGIGITNFSWPGPASDIGPTVARIARIADEAGLDSIWTMDHFFQIRVSGEPPEAPMLEAYATLSFIAGHTRRIQLGTMVTAVPNRHPGVLVKIVTSLDVLSGGRAIFGVGAGAPFNVEPGEGEAGGLGIPYPPTMAERFECLEELLQIAHQMWRGDERPFAGKHYQLHRPLNSPNALRRPHPPILIGGGGERKTLRLVAQYGDACNLFDLPGTEYQGGLVRKLDVLKGHCHAVGRDYNEIEKTATSWFDPGENPREGAKRLVEHMHELAAQGIDHVLVGPRRPWDDAALEVVTMAVPDVHAIRVGVET